MGRANNILLAALFVVAAAAWFVLSTVLMDELADGVLVVVTAFGALVLAAAADTPSATKLRALDRNTVTGAVVAGALIVFAAPIIVLANRFTDAPPGTETLFFTTAAWGVLGVLGARLVGWARPSIEQMAFSLVGLLGVAALVANWERPSSFSPMVRYASQELGFLFAGACWVGGSLLLQHLLRDGRRDGILFVASGSGLLVAVAYALYESGPQGFAEIMTITVAAFVLAAAFGVMFVAWSSLISAVGVARSSALWFLPAALITAVTFYEQAVSPRGPDPVIWAGAFGGIALAALGAAGVWLATRRERTHRGLASTSLLARIAATLSVFAVIAGAISLVLPAFTATVTGTLSDGQAYNATWDLLGYESAGGWIPVLAGALLLAASFGALGGPGTGRTGLVAAAGLALIAGYWFVADTPLHTWNRWVPVEIQTEYGTEYALIQFATVHDPVRIAALFLGAAAALVLFVLVFTDRAAQVRSEPVTPEVQL